MDHDSKEYGRERRSRTRSKGRATSRPKDFRHRARSPHPDRTRRDRSAPSPGNRNQNTRSGSTFISFHINGPGKTAFLLDTGAQRSCMGKCTFVEMGGDLKSLNKSKNSFIFGDGPSTSSLGVAKINILGHVFNIDIVSRDIPDLIGMDILSSQYRNRPIFRLSLGGRQLMIDNDDIDLLGDRQGHLHLPDNIVKISSSFTQGQSLSKPKTNSAYFQAEYVSRDGSRG